MPQCYWDITLSAKLRKNILRYHIPLPFWSVWVLLANTLLPQVIAQVGKCLYFLANNFYCNKISVSLTPLSDQGQSPAGKMVYPGGPGTKITSVSTGNLCADVSNCRSKASGVLVLNAPADQLTLECQEQSWTHSI